MYAKDYIAGLTTNPTLMRKAGVTDYEAFAKDLLTVVRTKPISFEVISDDFSEMHRQAVKIASWGDNVYVKIPVTNSSGESSAPLVRELCEKGIKVNVTALMTLRQVEDIAQVLVSDVPSCVSVFAGRIADTGVDPLPVMKKSLAILSEKPAAELIWASPRELLNVMQGDDMGCHIITVTHDILRKLSGVGKNLGEFSLETVRMFADDAAAAGYEL